MEDLTKISRKRDLSLPEISPCKLCEAGVKDEHPRCKGCGFLAGQGHPATLNKEGHCEMCQADLKRYPGTILEPTKPIKPVLWLDKKGKRR